VELTCHGVPSIVARILDLLQDRGARRAEPGEFTRRALAAETMTPLDVLALADLVSGTGRGDELTGILRDSCNELLTEVRSCQESLEGEIEFGEPNPDAGFEDMAAAAERITCAAVSLGSTAAMLETEHRVVLMGPVNSGKSTLFNLLSGACVLVSGDPGTTRDGASRSLLVRGRRVLLSDSAGTGGEGMDLAASVVAEESIGTGDRVVWMSDSASVPVPSVIRARAMEVIEVSGKCDISVDRGESAIRVSSVTGEGLEELRDRMAASPGTASITGLAGRVEASARSAMDAMAEGDLPLAAVHLQEIEGAVEGMLDRGPSMAISIERALERLCVGK